MSIIYEKLEIPDNYKCSRCAAHGVKLWRQYNRMAPSRRTKDVGRPRSLQRTARKLQARHHIAF